MKFLKNINESFSSGDLEFNADFDGVDIDLDQVPKDWSERDLKFENGKIRWTLNINSNKRGIEWFAVTITQLILSGIFEDDEELEFEFELQDVETELNNITESFYVTSINIDMNNSKEEKDWSVKVYFGNP